MTVTIGTPATVDAAASNPIDIAELTSSLAIAVYERDDSGPKLKARTVTISGGTLTPNAEVNIDPASIFLDQAVLVGLTDTTAMVIYDASNTSVRARILSVSGTTITVNSQTTLTAAPFTSGEFGACFVSSTKVLFCYQDSSSGSTGKAVMLSVSGTTITENTIIDFDTGNSVASCKCAAYSTTRAIVTFIDLSAGSKGYGVILSISGDTLTKNTRKEIEAATTWASGPEDTYAIMLSSTKVVFGGLDSPNGAKSVVLTLNGVTFDIGTVKTETTTIYDNLYAAKLSETALITLVETNTNVLSAVKYNVTGGSSDVLTEDGTDTLAVTGLDTIRAAPVSSGAIIAHYIGTSSRVVLATTPVASHLWLSTDGAATFSNIGGSWGSDVVGGVVVVPGTAYQTIFAAVGTDLYKTVNGGTAWALETAIGYEVDFLDLEKDNTTVFMAKRDAAGTNRASLWDGSTLTHINTGKSTTGGATSGGDVV